MTLSIDTLPAEILEVIVSSLEVDDVMKLSTTCRALRARTAHRVFHTVRFSNDSRIADAALVAAKNHGPHIKVLRFVGYAGEEDDKLDDEKACCRDNSGSADDEWDSDLEPVRGRDGDNEGLGPDEVAAPRSKPVNRDILPPSALILFDASATLLPSLEQFSINFDHEYDYSSEFNCPHGACMFEDSESWDMVHAREAKLTMCRLWANTYKALAGNKTVAGLVIENWSPRAVSTFQTAEWRAYLGRLKSLDIRITGARQAWSFTNSMEGYVKDIARMQGFFFHHVTTLQILKVSIWPEIPFGMHGTHHMPLPLRATGRMQALEHLELENAFISCNLVAFILGYKAHLRTVVLRNAQSAAAEYGECASRPLPWSDFFDALSAGLGREDFALTQLTVTSPAPLSETEAKTGRINYKTERAAIKQVREELRSDSRRRLFGYGDFHEHHGYFIHDVRTNQQSAISGTDQAAWDRLVAKLDARRGYVTNPRAAEAEREKKDGCSESDKPAPESKAKRGGGAGSGKKTAAASQRAEDGAGATNAGAAKAGPAEAGATVDVPIRTTRSRKRQSDDAQEAQPRRSGRIAKMREQDPA